MTTTVYPILKAVPLVVRRLVFVFARRGTKSFLEWKLKAIGLGDTRELPLGVGFDKAGEITSLHPLDYHATSAELEPHGTMTPRLLQDGRNGIRVAIENRALFGFVDQGKSLLNLRKPWDKDAHLFPDFEDQRLDKEAIVREGQYLLVGPFMDSNMNRVENRKPNADGDRQAAPSFGKSGHVATNAKFVVKGWCGS